MDNNSSYTNTDHYSFLAKDLVFGSDSSTEIMKIIIYIFPWSVFYYLH